MPNCSALHCIFAIGMAQFSPSATKPVMAARRSFAPNTQMQQPAHESMLYDSPYTSIYYNKQSQPGCCGECIAQGKECSSECITQTRHCLSEMSLCQALGVGCILPPLCTPLLVAWCWYRGNGVRDY